MSNYTQAEQIAFLQGDEAAQSGLPKKSPYYEEKLKSAWENGWEWFWETNM